MPSTQMDDWIEQWYKGLQSPRAVGATFTEALSTYMRNSTSERLAPSDERDMDTLQLTKLFEYTGIEVGLTEEDQLQILQHIHNTTGKWLPLCIQGIPRGQDQSTDHTRLEISHQKLHPDIHSIRWLSSHYVPLFRYGLSNRRKDAKDSKLIHTAQIPRDSNTDVNYLRRFLSPYEFAVATLYRHFYKIPFPSVKSPETGANGGHQPSHRVRATLKHVIFVPSVVICATTLLKAPLVSLPSTDERIGNPVSYELGEQSTLVHFVEQCQEEKSLMLEEGSCTYVTLGVGKTYKPVVSNGICQAIKGYLQYLKGCPTSPLSDRGYQLKKVTKNGTLHGMEARELLDCLDIYSSDFSELHDARNNLVQLSELLREPNDAKKVLEASKISMFKKSILQKHGDNLPSYQESIAFVSEDMKWVLIRNLPIALSACGSDGAAEQKWAVDAYVCAWDREVTGSIKFY